MNSKHLICVLMPLVFQLMDLSTCAKILVILPIPFIEHQVVYQPLIQNLHKHEHHITVMTTNPGFREFEGQVLENITEIDLSFVYDLDILNELKNVDLEGSDMIKKIFNVMRNVFKAELKSPKVKELLSNKDQYFDLVMVDWSGSSSLMNVFAYHFNAPLVAITNGEAFPNVHEAFGNLNHPVTFPSVFLPFSNNLNLFQRVSSVLSTIWYRFYYYNREIPLQNEIIKSVMYEDQEESPDMWSIETNADLLLINSYEILSNIRPSVPTTVYLGGIHQKLDNNAEISSSQQQLQRFFDESETVVYVNLNNAIQDTYRVKKLLNALEKAQVDIVWNSMSDDVNSTARIFQSSPFDHENILAHPKVALHITDGGQRNIEDSIHHAVPIMGISYSSTLEHYLYQIEKFDCGIISYIDYDNHDEFESKIDDLLNSKKYKTNILRLKSLVLDQPIGNSIQRATWWINYVIRNGGTKHLQNDEFKSLSWIKYLMLDVLLTVTIGFVSVLAIFAYIIVRIRRYSQSLPFEKVTRKAKLKSF